MASMMNCPKLHGSLRETSLETEWHLKGMKSVIFVCDTCRGVWVDNPTGTLNDIKKKMRASLFARGP
jgi:Zn-finger nucleic acid-binding protein